MVTQDDVPSTTQQKREDQRPADSLIMTDALRTLIDKYCEYLYLPDPTPVQLTLATVVAHRMGGAPVWLMIIGPPSSGKSENLQAIVDLPDVYSVGTLSEAGLLSGTSQKDRDEKATGGLLMEMENQEGIILCKDFTSIIDGPREKQSQVLAGLREIHDGSWTRVLGTDGGRSFSWKGRVGFIGATTGVIDRHQNVMSKMGPRFLLYRMPVVDTERLAREALQGSSREARIREELKRDVAIFLSELDLTQELPARTESETDHFVAVARLVVTARSAVVRDDYSKTIELILEPEAPPRLVKSLERLWVALQIIGVGRSSALRIVTRVALDCIPMVRRKILDVLISNPSEACSIETFIEATGYKDAVVRRHLEELEAHGLFTHSSHAYNKFRYLLSDQAREWIEILGRNFVFPECRTLVPEDEILPKVTPSAPPEQISTNVTTGKDAQFLRNVVSNKIIKTTKRKNPKPIAPPASYDKSEKPSQRPSGSGARHEGLPWDSTDGIGGE